MHASISDQVKGAVEEGLEAVKSEGFDVAHPADRLFADLLLKRPLGQAALLHLAERVLRLYRSALVQRAVSQPSSREVEEAAQEALYAGLADLQLDAEEIPAGAQRVYLAHERIIVEFPYEVSKQMALAPLKETVPNWDFNRYRNKEWSYPLEAIEQVVEALSPFQSFAFGPQATLLSERTQRTTAYLQEVARFEQYWQELEHLEAQKCLQDVLVGPALRDGRRLYDHQREAVMRLVAQGRLILAHDLGLGKTLSALLAAQAYRRPIWVIAPISTHIPWLREAEALGISIEVYSWAKVPAAPEVQFVLIGDEAHAIQSLSSQRTRAFLALAERATAGFLLSVTGETPVVLKVDNKIRVLMMREAVELIGLQGEGNLLVPPEKSYYTRSYNAKTHQMTWARVYCVQAHKSPEPLVKIEAQGKVSLRVTQSHSVYVVRDGKVEVPKASDIQPGDFLIRDERIEVPQGPESINMVERVADSAYVLYGPFEEQISRLRDEAGYDACYNWSHNGKHGAYLPYNWWVKAGRPKGTQWIAGLKGSRGHGCQALIPVTSLAYLVGLVAGDGWVSDSRLGLAVANKDVDAVSAHLEQYIRPYFDYSVNIRQFNGCVNLRIQCKPLVDLFRQWFGGQRAPTKRLPNEILTWSEDTRKEVLRGIIDSDGYIAKSANMAIITSTSRMLLEDMATLLRTLGTQSASYTRRMKPDPRPTYANAQQSYSLHFSLGPRSIRYLKGSQAQRNVQESGISFLNADLVMVVRVTIEEPTEELVYDFSVEETENFVAGSVVCHNTGTPMKNAQATNLYPLLVACKHPLGQDQRAYEARYCSAYMRKIGRRSVYEATGAVNLDELHEKTRDVILFKKKSECLDLPPKVRVLRPAETTPEVEQRYEETIERLWKEHEARMRARQQAVVKMLVAAREEGEDIDPKVLEAAGSDTTFTDALVEMGILRHAASLAKVDAAVAVAEEVLDQGGSIVLFSVYRDTATQIALMLHADCLSGETKAPERQAMIDRFQARENRCLVCTAAGGLGITLTAAQTVVLVERPWTPGDVVQFEDRTHRIGQVGTVTSIWLQYGPMDDRVDHLLEQKQRVIDHVLVSQDQMAVEVSGMQQSVLSAAREILRSIKEGIPLDQLLSRRERELIAQAEAAAARRSPVLPEPKETTRPPKRAKAGRPRKGGDTAELRQGFEISLATETLKRLSARTTNRSAYIERLILEEEAHDDSAEEQQHILAKLETRSAHFPPQVVSALQQIRDRRGARAALEASDVVALALDPGRSRIP